MPKLKLASRQIHLDFHTGPGIPDVGADFDARAFAATMKQAQVSSVTVFGKCHHGHLYFPTRHPARHPGLKKGLDLVGEQIEALHREGIRAPIYISWGFDEFAANEHPVWVVVGADGKKEGAGPLEAGWQVLDISSPYQDYLVEQTREILERYKPVDGLFFDICMSWDSASAWAIEGMRKSGYDPTDEKQRKRYADEAAMEAIKRLHRLVKRSCPSATVAFNSRPMDEIREDLPYITHIEIEALATGLWGYMYFPKNVRYARNMGKPCLGMTARFHKNWADFGGLKPYPALLYEVSQMLAHGVNCSIGDQLHPRGRLDGAVYKLIGSVYDYVTQCEPWTEGATPLAEVGLFRVSTHGQYFEPAGCTNDGAARMFTQLKLQFDVVDAESDLERYRLLVLPDEIPVDQALASRLRAFVQNGGSLLLSGTSGLGEDLRPVLPEMGVSVEGESPYETTYIRFGREIGKGVPATEHVMYERGLRMAAGRGATVLAKVCEPYFERTYEHFSSHFQTPPAGKPSRYAAAIQKGRVITIPYPIFRAFGTHANVPYRQLVERCIDRLLPEKMVTVRGPSSMEITVLKQGRRTVVHLLQFVPERRAPTLDVVEDIFPVYDVPLALRAPRKPRRVYMAPSGADLAFAYADGYVSLTVPCVNGHEMVVFE